MARVLLVSGTCGRRTPWWRIGHPFVRALTTAQGHALAAPSEGRSWWGWTTRLDGVLGRDDSWIEAAASLYWYTMLEAQAPDAVIAHSHGGNVLALAAHRGAHFGSVVTVGTPRRRTLASAYRALQRQSRRWTHLYTPGDAWQILGTWRARRPLTSLVWNGEMPDAHVNIRVTGLPRWRRWTGLSHTSDLLDPARWTREQWWGLLDKRAS